VKSTFRMSSPPEASRPRQTDRVADRDALVEQLRKNVSADVAGGSLDEDGPARAARHDEPLRVRTGATRSRCSRGAPKPHSEITAPVRTARSPELVREARTDPQRRALVTRLGTRADTRGSTHAPPVEAGGAPTVLPASQRDGKPSHAGVAVTRPR
jgi:hypothetical protein